jgi:hypothetical protein
MFVTNIRKMEYLRTILKFVVDLFEPRGYSIDEILGFSLSDITETCFFDGIHKQIYFLDADRFQKDTSNTTFVIVDPPTDIKIYYYGTIHSHEKSADLFDYGTYWRITKDE